MVHGVGAVRRHLDVEDARRARPPRPSSTMKPTAVSRSRSARRIGRRAREVRRRATRARTSSASPRPVQEADVVLEEEAQVGDAVDEHRDPVDAAAEGEAAVALGVDPAVREDRSGGPSRRP